MEVVIVSRHQGTIEVLRQIFPEAQVVQHISNPREFKGALLIGNFPLEMIAELKKNGNRVIVVNLRVPPEMRGKELSKEEVQKFMKLLEVEELKLSEFIIS